MSHFALWVAIRSSGREPAVSNTISTIGKIFTVLPLPITVA